MYRPLLLLLAAAALAGCDDSTPTPGAATTFDVTVENVSMAHPFVKSGVFDTPVGAPAPGPILPGQRFEVAFTAGPGLRLSFATMFAQSNDLFYAFAPDGLALYGADRQARTGDVTAELMLWDAGTEVNEEPGTGPNQAPRQPAPNTGPAEGGVVRPVNDGYTYPAPSAVIRATLAHDGGTGFVLTIENVSTPTTLMHSGGSSAVPLSPGAWAVHGSADATFFETNSAASEGIERIAEDGDPMAMGQALAAMSGRTVPLSPGVAVVHTSAARLFTTGEAAPTSIERIAEDGDPMAAVAAMTGAEGVREAKAFTTPDGASAAGPAMPGQRFRFTVEARPGDRLSLATMYAQSNDLFYAFAPDGLALFTGSGTPASGDVTAQVRLWDAGTEADEEPNVGPFQAPRQPAPNTGPAENGVVVAVDGTDSGYTYPAASAVVRVTVTAR